MSAFAQSSVTMYGIAEATYLQKSVTGNDSDVTKNVTTKGLSDGTTAGRIGFKGTEDLGAGLTANFTMEAGMYIANGASLDKEDNTKNQETTEEGRQTAFLGKTRTSIVGVGSKTLGSLNLGYKKTVETDFNDTFNMGAEAAGAGNTAHLVDRITRAKGFYYTAPAMGPVTVNAQYTGGSASYDDATQDAAKKIDISIYALAAVYKNGPLTAGASMASGKVDGGTGNSVAPSESSTTQFAVAKPNDYKQQSFAAAYDLGVAKISGMMGTRKSGDTTAANLQKTKYTNMGVTVPVGKWDLIAVTNKATHDKADGTEEYVTKGNQLQAKYNFSKRTAAYVLYGTEKKDQTTGDDVTTKVTHLGLIHSF
jgi:predicted porin